MNRAYRYEILNVGWNWKKTNFTVTAFLRWIRGCR